MREGMGGLTRYRWWSVIVLLAILAFCAVVISTNYTVDAYGIHRTDFTKQQQEPNKNYLKIKFLLANKDKYDSFLFGSSRVTGIDVKKIGIGRFYNMTYSEGLPQEHLNNVRFLLKNGVRMKTIMIGLDDFSYRVDPRTHLNDLLRQPYPDISGKSWLTFYADYYANLKSFTNLLKNSFRAWRGRKEAQARTEDEKIIFHDIYDSGRVLCSNCDDEIERDPEAHRKDPKFEKPFHYDGDNLAGALAALRELAGLAKREKIRLILFINPIHRTTYLDTDLPLFFRFKRGLADIADYYDFSGLNTITTDNYYYHETSHYREMVGDMMLKRMFGIPDVPIPSDFGVLVTERNVQEHLRALRMQVTGIAKSGAGKKIHLPVEREGTVARDQ